MDNLTPAAIAEQAANFEKIEIPLACSSLIGLLLGSLLSLPIGLVFHFNEDYVFILWAVALLGALCGRYYYLSTHGWTQNKAFMAYLDSLEADLPDALSRYETPHSRPGYNMYTDPSYSHVPGNSFYR